MIGQLLGHYRIVEKIGAGGMGEVYRAHDEQLERDVALKVLPIGLLADESARKRFRKEALALAKLNHPNIETIYEFATQDGVDFLAMELIAGLTLSQKMNAGLLPNQETLKLGAQIAEGLNAAHERGVVHCDLKPGNVMVTANGHAKVLDFGLARFFHTSKDSLSTDTLTETQPAGTLPYMSPEQVRGECVDSRTDIYSAGAVLYEMSTGQRPFPETQAPRLIDAILHQEPSRPTDVNRRVTPGLENILLKALDKNPERRYQSARELAVDLGRLSSPGLPILLPRRSKRRRAWILSVTATLLVGLLGFAIYSRRHYFSQNRTPSVANRVDPDFTSGKRLAILAIEAEGDQSSLGYVANGLSEYLNDRLSQLQGLKLAAPDEVDNLDPSKPLDKIGRALGVNIVLRGLIRVAPPGLHVTISLQSIAGTQPFWTHEFEGRRSDISVLEDQMYERLLAALDITETEDEKFQGLTRAVVSSAAYDLYLRGREKMRARQAIPDPEGAIQLFEQALKKDGSLDSAYVGLAKANLLLFDQQKNKLFLQRAIIAGRRAIALNNSSASTHSALGSAYIAAHKYAEAIDEFKRAVSLMPASDEACRRLGGAYVASGDYPHAILSFRKAVDLNPYFWVNHNALGDAYFRAGYYPDALQAFQQVSVLAPDISAGYDNMGNVYAAQGKYQEAVPYFKKALEIEPYFSTYSNLGTCYFFLKQYANAVEMFEKAVTFDRADTSMMVNMADSYRFEGKPDRARAAYQQAISLGNRELKTNPKSSDVMAQMALCYANLGEAQQAETYVKRARGIDKTSLDILYYQVQIYALLGKTAEALAALREALEKHYPADVVAADPNVDSLRNNPEFNDLIKKYSGKKPPEAGQPAISPSLATPSSN